MNVHSVFTDSTKYSLLLLFVLIPLLQGCSALDLLNAPIPTQDLQFHENISYGPKPRQALNVYAPKESSTRAEKPLPVVLFFYGGRWSFGERDEYMFVAQAMAEQGYITVIPDYRLYPDHRYPSFVRDGAKALEWTKKHIRKYGGNEREIFLMGHSAGAYIAAMLSLNHEFLEEVGLRAEVIRGTIGIAGPYDFLPLESKDLRNIFQRAEPLETSQPIHYADRGTSPFLLIAGQQDTTVDPGNTTRLAKALRRNNVPVETKLYPRSNHVDVIIGFAYPLRGDPPIVSDVDRFIQSRISSNQEPTSPES